MSDVQIMGLSVVFSHLDAYVRATRENANAAAEEIATTIADYAKANHPWTVRTGATNLTTSGTVVDTGDVIDIYIAAGMDYDVFLELARAGKWAWLWPALEANRDTISGILVKHLSGMGAAGPYVE